MSKWIVKVEKYPNFCGEGAGGAQFAHGQAEITNARLADWFAAHKGYTVTEVKEAEATVTETKKAAANPAKK